MQKTGIINPDLLHLLARIRHTNLLVIADRGFPFWPMIETVDISLVDGIPTVLQVVNALRLGYDFTQAYMAQEFLGENNAETHAQFADALRGIPLTFEAHEDLKKRVPDAIGLIRTGDTTQYTNLILLSGRP
jgi:D-ribose pyranase